MENLCITSSQPPVGNGDRKRYKRAEMLQLKPRFAQVFEVVPRSFPGVFEGFSEGFRGVFGGFSKGFSEGFEALLGQYFWENVPKKNIHGAVLAKKVTKIHFFSIIFSVFVRLSAKYRVFAVFVPSKNGNPLVRSEDSVSKLFCS